jgi:hypothetical protein
MTYQPADKTWPGHESHEIWMTQVIEHVYNLWGVNVEDDQVEAMDYTEIPTKQSLRDEEFYCATCRESLYLFLDCD